jgi:hypothetical protein
LKKRHDGYHLKAIKHGGALTPYINKDYHIVLEERVRLNIEKRKE